MSDSRALRAMGFVEAESASPVDFQGSESVAAAPRGRISRRSVEAAFLATLYALFVIFFPWEEIMKAGFSDFDAYVDDFNYYSAEGITKAELYELTTVRQYLVSEVLWHELARTLTSLTGEATVALHGISFFVLFVWGYTLFKRIHRGVALLFLLNPMAIDMAMSGIRNALAWALVIIALSMRSWISRVVLFLVGTLIHTTTLVLMALYYFAGFVKRTVRGPYLGALALAGAGAFIGLAVTIGNEIFLGALGDRRTGEDYIRGGGSLLMALVWAVMLGLQITSGRRYVRANLFVIGVLAWYLVMNPFIPWAFRVWACLLPVIAVSALNLPKLKRQIFLALYTAFLAVQYLYWTKLFDYWYPA